MNSQPPTGLQSVWLLLKLGLRRFWNRLSTPSPGKKKGGRRRTGTARKRSGTGILALIFMPLVLLYMIFMSNGLIHRVADFANHDSVHATQFRVGWHVYRDLVRAEEDLDRLEPSARGAAREEATNTVFDELREELARNREFDQSASFDPPDLPEYSDEQVLEKFKTEGLDGFVDPTPGLEFWPSGTLQFEPGGKELFFRSMSLLYVALFTTLALLSLATRHKNPGTMSRGFVWLFTFPISSRSILSAKLCEYFLTNAANWVLFGTLNSVLLANLGWGWGAIPIGLAITAVLGISLAAFQILAENWLRMKLPVSTTKNIQALCPVLSILIFLSIVLVIAKDPFPDFFKALARGTPDWLLGLPTSLPLLVNPWVAADVARLFSITSAVLFPVLCILYAASLLRGGVIPASNAHQGRRGTSSMPAGSGGIYSGIFGKELHLILRDRNFLVQTIVVPAIVIGFQILIRQDMLDAASANQRHSAALAYGVSAYLLMGATKSLVAGEGRGLWILYTFPHSLESMLRRKVKLWIGVAVIYATVVLLLLGGLPVDLAGIELVAMVFLGLFIYAHITSGISAITTDPFEEDHAKTSKESTTWLQLFLASAFVPAIYADDWWTRIATIVLTAAVAIAIWETVRERLPYLLDPIATPKPRIRLSHGLLACLAFFALQVTISLAFFTAGSRDPSAIVIAYASAGLIVVLATRLFFALLGIYPDEGRTRAEWREEFSTHKAVLLGLGLGVLTASIGFTYLLLIEDTQWFRDLTEGAPMMGLGELLGLFWTVALAVIAAPICEEYIFRGLVYRGLRGKFSVLPATLASAALFTVVHPPVSWLPVFCVGIATALALEHSRRLITPIIVHALYNAVILISE